MDKNADMHWCHQNIFATMQISAFICPPPSRILIWSANTSVLVCLQQKLRSAERSYNHCQNRCNKTNINIFSTTRPTFASPPFPLNNVVSPQNVSDLVSIACHNISIHGKPTLNRGGEGDIKNCEMPYFYGHVTTHFVNECGRVPWRTVVSNCMHNYFRPGYIWYFPSLRNVLMADTPKLTIKIAIETCI